MMVRALLALIIYHMSFVTSMAQLGRYKVDFFVSESDFADSIVIEWTNGQVYVPVTIEGRTLRFLLDTGASQTVVFQGTSLANGPHVGGIISYDATGRTDTVPMVLLPPVQIGGLLLTGMRATVQPRYLPSTVDGILGFDLVNGGLSMKIDVPARQLILTDRKRHFETPTPLRERQWESKLTYHLNFHVPYIDIVPFGRHAERVLFDTGSRQFFSMNKSHFDDAFWRLTKRQAMRKIADSIVEGRAVGRHAIGHFGVEPLGEVIFLHLDDLQIGTSVFTDVHALTTQGGSHIGASLLQYGSVTFIPRKRQFIFQPAFSSLTSHLLPQIVVANRQLEIAFVADALGRPEVGLVWEQGVPYRLGFRQGDIIEKIDHRPVQSMAQFLRWSFQRGREYVFTLCSSQGKRRDVSWVRLREN
jgi:predicted aspartyl protease